MMTIAALLARARREAGFTQRDLAAAADMPQSSVSRIERGRISPRASTIERWLMACDRALTLTPLDAARLPSSGPAKATDRFAQPVDVDEDREPSDWAPWLR